MWKNYFVITLRNLSKRKLYAGINVFGFTIALVSFLAIVLYIYHETCYDKMYSDYERIYKFNQEFKAGGETQLVGTTPSSLVPTILEEVAEVESATLVFDLSIFSSVMVNAGEGNQEESKFAFADANFFKVFDLPLLYGNPDLALSAPHQLVLTASTAKRYFRSADQAVGKQLEIDGESYTVSAVMADFPSNSHMDFDFLASFLTHRHGNNPEWSPSNYYSYVKLSKKADLPGFSTQLEQMVEKYLGEAQKSYGFNTAFYVQPVSDLHLANMTDSSIKPGTDIRYLYIFGIVALLLILIGIINYVNLATAEATERNKEVGLRKVLGANRSQLFGQFVAESFVLTLTGLVLSVFLLILLEPTLVALTGVPMQTIQLFSAQGILFLIALLLVTAVFAGFYPALILSGMEPLKALGKSISFGGGGWLRKGLVVFQFFVSISLLTATLVVRNQLNYMQEVNLGYEREELLALSYHYNMRNSVASIKQEMLRSGSAQQVSLAADMPIHIKAGYKFFPGGDNEKELMITGYSGDHDIVRTLGLRLVAGSDFTEQDLTRTQGYKEKLHFPIMINEAAVKELGWSPEEAIGKLVDFGGSMASIKAVVGDFYFNSLHHQVGPLCLVIDPEQSNVLLVKLNKGNPQEHLATLEGVWKNLAPERPFNYRFVNEAYGQMYTSEVKIGKVFGVFAGIAIAIACLGLFGLVSYVALRRTKEISIRKVLGADASDVLKVLSTDFFKLLAISAVLSVAFGWWFSDVWLQSFAYRSGTPIWIYLISILVVTAISLFTIGYRTASVFLQNPAQTLKES